MKINHRNWDNFQEAISFITNLTGVDEADMLSKSRFRDGVVAKHFLRYYLRENFNMTYEMIGELTNCHHATVIHSLKYVKDYSLYDKTYRLYKSSIDTNVLDVETTERELITSILYKRKSNEFKCNAILSLINDIKNGQATAQ